MEPSRGLDRPSRSDGPLGPVTDNKMRRITRHTQQLVDDLQEWVDLRIELAQIELEERVETKVNQIALQVVVIGVVLLAVVFGLVTIALGLGAWIGHPAWGFLIVTGLLVALAAVVRAARPEFVQVRRRRADVADRPSETAAAPRESS